MSIQPPARNQTAQQEPGILTKAAPLRLSIEGVRWAKAEETNLMSLQEPRSMLVDDNPISWESSYGLPQRMNTRSKRMRYGLARMLSECVSRNVQQETLFRHTLPAGKTCDIVVPDFTPPHVPKQLNLHGPWSLSGTLFPPCAAGLLGITKTLLAAGIAHRIPAVLTPHGRLNHGTSQL